MLTIKPDFNDAIHSPICHYCGNNKADKDVTKTNYFTFFRVISGNRVAYRYIEAKVWVPCCKDCDKKQSNWVSTIGGIILFLAPIIWLGLQSESFVHFLLLALAGGFIGAILAFAFVKIVDAIRAPSLAKQGIRIKDDMDSYPPIRILRKYGFHQTRTGDSEHPWDENGFYRDLQGLARQGYIIENK